MEDARETYEPEKVFHQSVLLRLLSHVLTILSYSAFIIALPITYWICIKRVGTSQKMIVFRLGKMIGAKGPGTVLVFPWLDRYQTVDVGDAAFSVPPQQLITHDGGIIEIGAEVQYAITDVVVMVREVADHQDILRSLAKTVLVRLLAKKQVSKLVKEKNICASEIMADLNRQVRKWGLDVRCVSLSEAKVLKKPEGNNGIAPLLQSLGMKEELLRVVLLVELVATKRRRGSISTALSKELRWGTVTGRLVCKPSSHKKPLWSRRLMVCTAST